MGNCDRQETPMNKWISITAAIIIVTALIVLLIIGLSKAHDTPAGKAVLAVLLPFGICVSIYFLFIFSFILGPLIFEGIGR